MIMFTERTFERVSPSGRNHGARVVSHKPCKVVGSPATNQLDCVEVSGVGFRMEWGRGGGHRVDWGSDIDLVVNFSAPAGLVATFVCARGMRGWGTIWNRGWWFACAHKMHYAFLRLCLHAIANDSFTAHGETANNSDAERQAIR